MANDIITHINNMQIKDYKKGEIKSLLIQEGKEVIFSIKSEGQTKEVTIKLHDIL